MQTKQNTICQIPVHWPNPIPGYWRIHQPKSWLATRTNIIFSEPREYEVTSVFKKPERVMTILLQIEWQPAGWWEGIRVSILHNEGGPALYKEYTRYEPPNTKDTGCIMSNLINELMAKYGIVIWL